MKRAWSTACLAASACLLLAAPAAACLPRRGPTESEGIFNCYRYCAAQEGFRDNAKRYGEHTHCSDLSLLDPMLDSRIVAAHGAGGTPHRGYLFLEMKTIAGTPVDWKSDYALCAIPVTYDRYTSRVFIVKTDGTVWGKDFGGLRGFVADFPADPAAEGWRCFEREPRPPLPTGPTVLLVLLLGSVTVLLLGSWMWKAESLLSWSISSALIVTSVAFIWFVVYYFLMWMPWKWQ